MEQIEYYIKKDKERLFTANRINTNKTRSKRITITRKQKGEEKQLYGYFN